MAGMCMIYGMEMRATSAHSKREYLLIMQAHSCVNSRLSLMYLKILTMDFSILRDGATHLNKEALR